jgi:hypothetical protein
LVEVTKSRHSLGKGTLWDKTGLLSATVIQRNSPFRTTANLAKSGAGLIHRASRKEIGRKTETPSVGTIVRPSVVKTKVSDPAKMLRISASD